jgi:hypothetical protein
MDFPLGGRWSQLQTLAALGAMLPVALPGARRRRRSAPGGTDVALAALLGAGVGAGLMYLFDPEAGARRRASAREAVLSVLRETGEAVNGGSRDVVNRARGLVIELGSRLQPGEVSDELLTRRIRSRLAAVVAYPEAVGVQVSGGSVTLTGRVPGHEVAALIDRVSAVRGVKGVENRLDVSPSTEARSP